MESLAIVLARLPWLLRDPGWRSEAIADVPQVERLSREFVIDGDTYTVHLEWIYPCPDEQVEVHGHDRPQAMHFLEGHCLLLYGQDVIDRMVIDTFPHQHVMTSPTDRHALCPTERVAVVTVMGPPWEPLEEGENGLGQPLESTRAAEILIWFQDRFSA